ncbi:hypothetical protein ACHAWF_012556 [Thalassiosira exigua]
MRYRILCGIDFSFGGGGRATDSLPAPPLRSHLVVVVAMSRSNLSPPSFFPGLMRPPASPRRSRTPNPAKTRRTATAPPRTWKSSRSTAPASRRSRSSSSTTTRSR